MTDGVDDEALELCRVICTRAGMLLEDASGKVILVGVLQPDQLRAAILDSRSMIGQADAFLAAAEALTAI